MREAGNSWTRLEAMGQSVWLDDIRRDMLENGSLVRLIEIDGVSGVTSNPAIFERAIKSGVYADTIAGKLAIASARLAYQDYLSMLRSERWQALHRAGAQPQRLLWASTSTKNPDYRDVRYVEELIGPQTVTTVPLSTLAAFSDHGHPRGSLIEGLDEAAFVLESLSKHDISLEAVTNQLTRNGIELFSEASDRILAALATNGSQHEVS